MIIAIMVVDIRRQHGPVVTRQSDQSRGLNIGNGRSRINVRGRREASLHSGRVRIAIFIVIENSIVEVPVIRDVIENPGVLGYWLRIWKHSVKLLVSVPHRLRKC